MSPLRQAMIEAMQLRQFSTKTQASYLGGMIRLTQYYHRSPDKITEQEAQKFILYLARERKLSWSTCNVTACSIRFFYKWVLRKSQDDFYIPLAKPQQKLPDIMTYGEIITLLSYVKNPKYRVALMTIYGAGLRISECAHLTINDIDSKEMVICVRLGKGNKDRYVPLSVRLLDALRQYWKQYRPPHWLFPGRDQQQPICTRTLRKAFTKAKEKANIQKTVSVHSLRHAFATHLLETGADIINIKLLLGHNSLSSTLRYTRFSKENMARIRSPLDRDEH